MDALQYQRYISMQQAAQGQGALTFTPDMWSKSIMRQYEDALLRTPRIEPLMMIEQSRAQYSKTLTDAIKQTLAERLPPKVKGEIGDKIIDALKKIDESHIRFDREWEEAWRYRMTFDFGDGAVVELYREHRVKVDDLRVHGNNGHTYLRTPYDDILQMFKLTDDEIARFAVIL